MARRNLKQEHKRRKKRTKSPLTQKKILLQQAMPKVTYADILLMARQKVMNRMPEL